MKKIVGIIFGILMIGGGAYFGISNLSQGKSSEVLSTNQPEAKQPFVEQNEALLNGCYSCKLKDGTDIEMNYISSSNRLGISSKKRGFANYEPEFTYENSKLSFCIDYLSCEEEYELSMKDDMLVGTRTYDGMEEEIQLSKDEKLPVISEFSTVEWNRDMEQQKAVLAEELFEEDNTDYSFLYNTSEQDKYEAFLKEKGLDQLVEGKKDTELIMAIFQWVCENYHHNNGTVPFPESRDVVSLDEFHEKNNGMNCRGLSLMLSQLLLANGVKARYVRCMPEFSLYQDCHVVVEAYSETLDQWIFLDPTHYLTLQTEDGTYVGVWQLRENILHSVTMIPNKESKFTNQELEEYLEYMAKNMHRFEARQTMCYNYGSLKDNHMIQLVPVGYDRVGEHEDSIIIVTTDTKQFFATPQ